MSFKKYGTSFAYIKYAETEYIYIDVLFIEPEYRNKGVATDLMIKFIKYCKDLGHRTIQLTVSNKYGSNLGRLIKFYEKLGFKGRGSGVMNLKIDLKPEVIKRRLSSRNYDYFKCVECNKPATHSLGTRSPDGIGYDMNCYCDQHQEEFMKQIKEDID